MGSEISCSQRCRHCEASKSDSGRDNEKEKEKVEQVVWSTASDAFPAKEFAEELIAAEPKEAPHTLEASDPDFKEASERPLQTTSRNADRQQECVDARSDEKVVMADEEATEIVDVVQQAEEDQCEPSLGEAVENVDTAIQQLVDRQMDSVRSRRTSTSQPINTNWVAPVIVKTARQRDLVKSAVLDNAIFSPVGTDRMEQVVDAFDGPLFFPDGADIIRQGDPVPSKGPALYLLESGAVDIYIAEDGQELPGLKVMRLDRPGSTFGEFALLYEGPRTATVKSAGGADAKLWSISFGTYSNLIDKDRMDLLAENEKLLSSVAVLKSLDFRNRLKVASAMKTREYQKGDVIIQMGQVGEDFFILREGRAHAELKCKTVKKYSAPDFFGELALLSEMTDKRAVDVVADTTPTVVSSISSSCFEDVLGSIRDKMLKRAQATYKPTKKKHASK